MIRKNNTIIAKNITHGYFARLLKYNQLINKTFRKERDLI